MFDSRQFLQFVVDRKLGFDHDRDLLFDSDRELLFDSDRELSFDQTRKLAFGMHGPVFRGRACVKCRYLVHPMEDRCRHCGTPSQPVVERPRQKAQEPPAEGPAGTQICPNCSFKVPADAVYCPRCRVKIDEWRDYIRRLREYERQLNAAGQRQPPAGTPAPYDYRQDYYNVPVRRR